MKPRKNSPLKPFELALQIPAGMGLVVRTAKTSRTPYRSEILREPVRNKAGWVPSWRCCIEGRVLGFQIQSGQTPRPTREEAIADLWKYDPCVSLALYQHYPELQVAEADQATLRLDHTLQDIRKACFGTYSAANAEFLTTLCELDGFRTPDLDQDNLVATLAADQDPQTRKGLVLALTDQAMQHPEGQAVVPPTAWMRALHKLAKCPDVGDLATQAIRLWDLRTQRLDGIVPTTDPKAPGDAARRERALNKWDNPILAEWAEGQGFKDPSGSFQMQDRVGHFEYGSWALNSRLGRGYATPFSTDHGGRTYLVEWTDQQKATALLARARELAAQEEAPRKAEPSRAARTHSLTVASFRHILVARHMELTSAPRMTDATGPYDLEIVHGRALAGNVPQANGTNHRHLASN